MADVDMEETLAAPSSEAMMAGLDPSSLFDACLDYLVGELHMLCVVRDSKLTLRDEVLLPSEICDRFVTAYQRVDTTGEIGDDFAGIFRDTRRTRVRRLKLRNSLISDAGLELFLAHRPSEIDLESCRNLTQAAVDRIGDSLSDTHVLRLANLANGVEIRDLPSALRLKRLIYHETGLTDLRNYMHRLQTLTHLEVTGCTMQLDPSCTLSNLVSLVLYNNWCNDRWIDWVCSLKNLQHLDLSQHGSNLCNFQDANQVLDLIVTSLPALTSLDISGTNLAGTGAMMPNNNNILCDIPGLSSRIANPLNFLGLYGTTNNACWRHDIPALRVAGQANIEQILTAATVYVNRPDFMTRVMNDLYHYFRHESKNVDRALMIVLKAMDTHFDDRQIQICGSAILFYITRERSEEMMGVKIKRHIIKTLLNSMENNLDDQTVMRNGCLALCQFRIPTDVVFDYERVVSILLTGVSNINQEVFVQKVEIYLLNSLACQVNAHQKRFLGDSGVISIMLKLIMDRLKRRLCDDILEVAWSTMWNVTDETPINCKRFLKDNGLTLFLSCLRNFTKAELLRNMMGLLGNVAEVSELRPIFMVDYLIEEFVVLLESSSDGIEVSYNAAGVLAHLAFDGVDSWSIVKPARHEVLGKMVLAIESWDIKSNRNINYRSFEPLMALLRAWHTPECQHWAIWALANLTTVYPEKYCSLVKAEDGIELLESIMKDPRPYVRIKMLAKTVLENCLTN